MRSIVRRDSGEGYQQFLERLAAGFNVGLLMRVRYGLRKPRSLSAGAAAAACALIFALVQRLRSLVAAARAIRPVPPPRQIDDRWNPALSAA